MGRLWRILNSMAKRGEVSNQYIDYNVDFRNIQYPRLEFKTGNLFLVLPKNFQDDKTVIKKHEKWIYQKNSQIIDALRKSKGKKLDMTRSKEELNELIKSLIDLYSEELNVNINKVYIKQMKTKWGSCSSKKNLTINSLLKYLPKDIIKYVIFHEMAHIFERKHNDRFWNHINQKFKDYKSKERELFVYWFLVQKIISSSHH